MVTFLKHETSDCIETLVLAGAKYVDCIFTNKVTSTPHLAHLYMEKCIYMPNLFFSEGHAV
jgi:hypothetical protein